MAVGPVAGGDGTYGLLTPRIDKTGAAVVVQRSDKYGEGTLRKARFGACDQSGTAPGTALGTTAHLVLYNPAGNPYRFRIGKVSSGYISGTLGAGTMFHCALNTVTQTAPSSGTLLATKCLDVGTLSVGTGVVRTGGTVVQPIAFRPFWSAGAELASTATGLQQAYEDLDGCIVLEPGTTYQMQAIAAAGSTPLIASGIEWEEELIV